jgi:hypothetical protein
MRADQIVELVLSTCKNDLPTKDIGLIKECGLSLTSAPVFDFGRFDYADFNDIQEDSMICWNEGLLEFPFPQCSFIHQYEYIDQRGKSFTQSRSMYQIERPVAGGPVFIAEWRAFNHDRRGPVGIAPAIMCSVFVNPAKPRSWTVEWHPNPWTLSDMVDELTKYFSVGNRISEFIDPVMAMTMYLNTNGVISECTRAPVALNKSRIKKGKLPIPTTHVVRIDPRILGAGGGSGDGHHASPRPHYRRGHIRRLDEGRTTWVKACIVAGSIQDARVPTYEVRK